MVSAVKVSKIQNTSGTDKIITENFATDSRFIRQIEVQADTGGYSFSTSWSLGPSFNNITGFKAGSLVEINYYIPLRNDSTAWGGAYIEPQVSYNGGTSWVSLGSSGYTGVMEYGQSIGFYTNTLLIDPNQVADFGVQVRFYLRAYDGTLTVKTSNAINSVSGTQTVDSGLNGQQHYSRIIVKELAKFS